MYVIKALEVSSYKNNQTLEGQMTPYVKHFIPDKEVEIFESIRHAVLRMPDIDLGKDEEDKLIILSCHMLARAVARVFSLTCVDGYFYPIHNHSWIVTPQRNIIDVYPIATLGGPTMMDGNNGIIARALYLPKSTREISSGRFSRKSFRSAVHKICAALQH